MSKFNKPTARATGTGPITTESTSSGQTHEGGPGFKRDIKSELFLLAVTNMVGEDTFYERKTERDVRYAALVREVTVTDPVWLTGFITWLRGEANMRSASLVAAAEGVAGRLAANLEGHSRQLVNAALRRADEPGELLAYWMTNYGRNLPQPLKRGIADAVRRLYTERALLKYDTDAHAFRFGDVIELTHPSPDPDKSWQGNLFRHALDRRHNHEREIPPDGLQVIMNNRMIRRIVANERYDILLNPDTIKSGGMTWEDVLSLAGSRVDKRKLWEALIPSMGYMALLRNLRNFDESGVSDQVAAQVSARLADPVEVQYSRQLPLRFLSAYRAAPSLRWAYALEQALGHSLSNVAPLRGHTLILVDTSSSMNAPFSKDGKLKRWDAAVLFAMAMANRCAEVDVISYSSNQRFTSDPVGARTARFTMQRGESVLRSMERWQGEGFNLGGGTETELALRDHFEGHDRVVIFTDEQAGPSLSYYRGTPRLEVGACLTDDVPLYTWNLAGYEHGHMPGGRNRYTFGGLTDAAFKMIPFIEMGQKAKWPFRTEEMH